VTIVKHAIKKWEVSIIQFESNDGTTYKVTRRIPELNVSETKFFNSKEEAISQFQGWLH